MSTPEPLFNIEDSRLSSTANGPIPDSYTAGQHTVNAAGLVVRRGRVAITGCTDHLRDDITYLGDHIDVDSLPRDREGRIQSHALAALATRLYGLDELVGTDAMSWEQLIDANGSDAVATMVTPAVLVSHRNPSDPYAAYVDLVGRERLAYVRGLAFTDDSVISDIEDMNGHTVIRRPHLKRPTVRYRLRKAKPRRSDPVGTDRALIGATDRAVIRMRLSEIRKLHRNESDRVVVGGAPSTHIWVGHELVRRGTSMYDARRAVGKARVRLATLATEHIHLAALESRVAGLDRGSSAVYVIDDYRVRVSRATTGHYSLRVTTPTGKTIARTGKPAPRHVVAAFTNIQRS